jgi:O-acetyl-ADP-ribose deacetylase (regulator of RNase III)
MIRLTRGNLIDADVEALVNTVNTVGVMGKGIALQFKEAFPENYKAYLAACKAGKVQIGRMFVTRNSLVTNPRWIINFPTKKHWRFPARIEWIQEGLEDLKRVVREEGIGSIAIPPLGCGNGGLEWEVVRREILSTMTDLADVEILVYGPVAEYQAQAKQSGQEALTPARAMIAELVRRYCVLGIECSILEVQKLAWFLERIIQHLGLDNPLKLEYKADRYGPYSDRLRHLLHGLDGSYLRCEKRLSDAGPLNAIWFDETRREWVGRYLEEGEGKPYQAAIEHTAHLIDGFESPLGMELLATIDWLITKEGYEASVEAIKAGLRQWPAGKQAGLRKLKLFDPRLIELALQRLNQELANSK